MTKLEKYRLEHLSKFTQVMIFDLDGTFLESCDSLFDTNQLKASPLSIWFPVTGNIIDTMKTMDINRELFFPRVEDPAGFLSGVYDFRFVRIGTTENSKLLIIISDFTEIYDKYRYFQQKYNEVRIEKQHLETQLSKLTQQA